MRVPGQKFFVPANRLIAGMARSYSPKGESHRVCESKLSRISSWQGIKAKCGF